MPATDYSKNLRLLCDEYGTVSAVCRGMDINRQQFNKYLSGQITPSRHNRRLISNFFTIDEALLETPHDVFSMRSRSTPDAAPQSNGVLTFFEKMVATMPNETDKLRRYLGYYYQWFYSLGFEGYIVKSLISIYEQDGVIYSKTIEHLTDKSGELSDTFTFKYAGTLFYMIDRIFLLEYETLTKQGMNLSILNASHRSKITSIQGITTGVASSASREPSACRVEWVYLGKDINVREALKSCCLYKHDSDDIDPALKSRISNHIASGDFLLNSNMS